MSRNVKNGRASFAAYVDDLASLALPTKGAPAPKLMNGALDGVVAGELRARVSVELRREQGAFPTPRSTARRLVRPEIEPGRYYVDPAVGCGDLLLAVAERLPTSTSVAATLEQWGRRLAGTDVEEQFVRATRLRLALLASKRLAQRTRLDEGRLADLLPYVGVGEGEATCVPADTTVIVNPPFGSVEVVDCNWAEGRVNRAAVFFDALLENAEPGARFAALLPDVLRSGRNYARWRDEVMKRLDVETIESVGRFDRWTDVDVFILRGTAGKGRQRKWWRDRPASERVGDRFQVNVGAVVPHREPRRGHDYPYLRASDLPASGTHRAGAVRRRYFKRVFAPPFVVLRRTSGPRDVRRLGANLVTADEDVAVENHLIVCTPKDGTVKSCRALLDLFDDPATVAWINTRIRCRHLTVGVVADLPWREP